MTKVWFSVSVEPGYSFLRRCSKIYLSQVGLSGFLTKWVFSTVCLHRSSASSPILGSTPADWTRLEIALWHLSNAGTKVDLLFHSFLSSSYLSLFLTSYKQQNQLCRCFCSPIPDHSTGINPLVSANVKTKFSGFIFSLICNKDKLHLGWNSNSSALQLVDPTDFPVPRLALPSCSPRHAVRVSPFSRGTCSRPPTGHAAVTSLGAVFFFNTQSLFTFW